MTFLYRIKLIGVGKVGVALVADQWLNQSLYIYRPRGQTTHLIYSNTAFVSKLVVCSVFSNWVILKPPLCLKHRIRVISHATVKIKQIIKRLTSFIFIVVKPQVCWSIPLRLYCYIFIHSQDRRRFIIVRLSSTPWRDLLHTARVELPLN